VPVQPLRFPGGATTTATGRVKWFNATKGYGFIAPDSGGRDVFVHIRDVEKAGYSALLEGVRIAYDLRESKGRAQADNLRVG
jgi:cold shock protein